MKNKNSFLIIYLFIAFILGGFLMYYIVLNTNTLNVSTTSTSNSTCRACSETVIVNDGSLSAAVEKIIKENKFSQLVQALFIKLMKSMDIYLQIIM